MPSPASLPHVSVSSGGGWHDLFYMNGKEWYANLLLRPEWQKKRLKIMERDRWRCVACGVPTTRTLTVHHKGYLTGLMPWEYPDEMLETLCVEHHSERHVFPLADPDRCIWCGALVTNGNLAGRNGKHEFICETCVRKSEEKTLSPADIYETLHMHP